MKNFIGKSILTAQILTCAFLLGASGVSAQHMPAPPATSILSPKSPIVPPPSMPEMLPEMFSSDYEKALLTAENVSLQTCVRNGNVRVTGWTRNEVRVLTKSTEKSFTLRTLRSDAQKMPVWVAIEATKQTNGECLSGDIEINLPQNASFNLKSDGAADVSAENIGKVSLTLYSGDVSLSEIRREIEITTLSGNISVNESQGKILLSSMSGDIVVRHVVPLEVSDVLKVKSQSGNVTLFNSEHNSVTASSNLGEITFNGAPLNNAAYDFRTNIGGVRLLVPPTANFVIKLISTEQKITSPMRYRIEDCKCANSSKLFIFGENSVNTNFNLNVYNGTVTVLSSDQKEKR